MSRSIVKENLLEQHEYEQDQVGEIHWQWLWQSVLGMVILSLLMIVYMGFAIKVSTSQLNGLMAKGVSLQAERDGLILQKEHLQMHHKIERHARERLGYELAKNVKVVNIPR